MPLFPSCPSFYTCDKRKKISRVTLFLRTSPFRAGCESMIAGTGVMPKLFYEPLCVFGGVKTPHVRLACALRFCHFFARRQHVEARTVGCKTGLNYTFYIFLLKCYLYFYYILRFLCSILHVLSYLVQSRCDERL
jgi:hypothetical protein